MNEDEGRFPPDIFKRAVFDCVDKHIATYKMTYAECVGVLELVKHSLMHELQDSEED